MDDPGTSGDGTPPFRRALGGYRPADVERSLDALRERARDLESRLVAAEAAARSNEQRAERAMELAYRIAARQGDRAPASLHDAAEQANGQGPRVDGGGSGQQVAEPGVERREPAVDDPDAVTLGRHVEVRAGPFADLVALAAFERRLAGIRGVDDVHVRRFGDEQAVVDVRSQEPLTTAWLRLAVGDAALVEVVDERTVRVDMRP